MAVCIFVLRYRSYLLGIRKVHWKWKQTIKGEKYMVMEGEVTDTHLPFAVCAFATATLGGELTLVPWQLARTCDLHERHSRPCRTSTVLSAAGAIWLGDFAYADPGRVAEHRNMRVIDEVTCANCESLHGVEYLLRIDLGIDVIFC